MSKVDDVFNFADELVADDQTVTFVRKRSTYDPETGTTVETVTETSQSGHHQTNISEYGGLYQQNDVKIIIDPVQLNYIYITTEDYFIVPRDGADDEYMKVIEPTTGKSGYVIIARPQ